MSDDVGSKPEAGGEAGTEGTRDELKRLDPLLSKEAPAIIYLGLLDDGKTAVFLLEKGVTAEGDGRCHPSPEDCQRVHLRKGETEYFTGTIEGETGPQEVNFQLDILSITTKKTASASRAHAAHAAVSTAGRRALRSRVGRMGRLRYDRVSGKLRTLSARAYRSSMARAARRRAGLVSGSGVRASQSLVRGLAARASGHRAGLATP